MFFFATYLAVVSFLEYSLFPPTRGDLRRLLDGLIASGFQFFLFLFAYRETRELDLLEVGAAVMSIPAQGHAVSARAVLVAALARFYRLPVWAHVLISFALLYSICFAIIATQPILVVLVPVSIGILAIYAGRLRQWLDSVFREERRGNPQQHLNS